MRGHVDKSTGGLNNLAPSSDQSVLENKIPNESTKVNTEEIQLGASIDSTVICEFAHLTREIPADILWVKTSEREGLENEADSNAYGGLDHTGAGRGAP